MPGSEIYISLCGTNLTWEYPEWGNLISLFFLIFELVNVIYSQFIMNYGNLVCCGTGDHESAILIPPTEEHRKFYVTSVMMIFLHLKGLFGGEAHEDPNAHLKGFIEVFTPFKFAYISQESIRLLFFLLSLPGKVILWLRSFPWIDHFMDKSHKGLSRSILSTTEEVKVEGWDCLIPLIPQEIMVQLLGKV